MIQANSLIFPSPKIYRIDQIQKNLIFVPKIINKTLDINTDIQNSINGETVKKKCPSIKLTLKKSHNKGQKVIPCLFLKGNIQHKILVYFHSNAQDLSSIITFIDAIRKWTNISILAVQYPGYSIYLGQSNSETIQIDGISVIQYLKYVGYSLNNIVLIGRSIGSGPSVYLSEKYPLKGLILISPFLSLQEAVKDLYGCLIAKLIQNRFNNQQLIKIYKVHVQQYMVLKIILYLIHIQYNYLIDLNHIVVQNQFKICHILHLIFNKIFQFMLVNFFKILIFDIFYIRQFIYFIIYYDQQQLYQSSFKSIDQYLIFIRKFILKSYYC